MELTVHGRHVSVSHALANHAEVRFGAALGQHDGWVKRVVLWRTHQRARGGVDKRCKAMINLRTRAPLVPKRYQPILRAIDETRTGRSVPSGGRWRDSPEVSVCQPVRCG